MLDEKAEEKAKAREKAYEEMLSILHRMGYHEAFGKVLAMNLKSEKAISRMSNYLRKVKPRSAEEITDEMLAIIEERERWFQKKNAEYYNMKYNELLRDGLGDVDEEDEDEVY